MKPLRDIMILSLEQATVLPYLTYRLAHDGMRVIRLEHPVQADPNRKVGDPFLPGENDMRSYFVAFNAGKEALTINLKEPKGQELLRDLLVKLDVDIFATNQLPKNYEPLGIAYDILKEVKPDLIWMGLTGFGPDSNEAAYDPILQARGGLMELTGEAERSPQMVGIPLPDMGTSEHAYGLIMRALYERAVTGKGSRIDLSMMDSTVSWLTQPITMAKTFGKKMMRHGNTHEFFSPVNVYPTRDSYVFIAVGNDIQWQRLLKIKGFEGIESEAYVTNAGRVANVDELNAEISAVTRSWDTGELLAVLREGLIPVAKVQTVTEVCEDVAVRDRFLSSTDPVSGMSITHAPPPFMTQYLKENERRLSFPPRLGEHNQKLYGDLLGISNEDLEQLKRSGVI